MRRERPGLAESHSQVSVAEPQPWALAEPNPPQVSQHFAQMPLRVELPEDRSSLSGVVSPSAGFT